MASSIHRTTVNVPNPEAKKVRVALRLERARGSAALKLYPAGEAGGSLKVIRAGIARDPCDETGETALELVLPARASVDVHVVVEVAAGQVGTALFHLVDQRDGVDVGGVAIAIVLPAMADPPGQRIDPPNPCPVMLARPLYAVVAGDDPVKPATAAALAAAAEFDLVAPVTNPTGRALDDVQVYLEHLGESDAPFGPGKWNAGTMQPKDVFFATWRVGRNPLGATLRASVVVASAKTDPVRLEGALRGGRVPTDSPVR